MIKEKELILVVSDFMNNNKNPDRNETSLIRMPLKTRKFLEVGDELLKIKYKNKSTSLTPFRAFSKDIKELKKVNEFTTEELKRVGFVTKNTFEKLSKEDKTILKNNVVIYKPHRESFNGTILVGADPEFLLFNNEGTVISANNIFPKEGKIGSDGAMMEVRPNPSKTPTGLIKNIKDIFNEANSDERIKNFTWKASAYHKDSVRDYPVGGHIHLDNPNNFGVVSDNNRLFLFAVINKILDELLALPLIKLDGVNLGKSRRSECKMALGNNGYGFFGEWRTCNRRLEYRTLSGLWLMHPTISECIIGTAKAIVEESFKLADNMEYNTKFFTHPDIEINNHRYIYRTEFDSWSSIKIANEMQCINSSSYMKSMLNMSKAGSITKVFLNNWYEKMKRLSTYKEYSEQIDALYHILNFPREKMTEVGFDIKKNWLEKNEFTI